MGITPSMSGFDLSELSAGPPQGKPAATPIARMASMDAASA